MSLQQSIQAYVSEKKDIYNILLHYLENSSDIDDNDFEILKEKINNDEYEKDRGEIYQFLQILQSISTNHHYEENFINKIEKIIQYLKDKIKDMFSDIEIFYLFKEDKSIIRFLLENKIISISEEIFKAMTSELEPNGTKYWNFFNPELQLFIEESQNTANKSYYLITDPKLLENFDQNRQKGENDSYICKLIREDSVEEFISYVNKTNCPLNSEIQPSIFETHSILNVRNPTLIEYAAFFGSIQIFQYLQMNNVSLSSSLWLYAIHSKNSELIYLLESNKVEPPDNDYLNCFIESIKCHHNDIASYIQNNLLPADSQILSNEKVVSNALKCYNFEYFPSEFDSQFIFFHLCSNNYSKIVKLLVENKEKEIKENNVYKLTIFMTFEVKKIHNI